jgi:hypothetical protein
VTGTSSAAMASANNSFEPRNLNRAKPYPAKADSAVAPTPPSTAYSAVLPNHWMYVP